MSHTIDLTRIHLSQTAALRSYAEDLIRKNKALADYTEKLMTENAELKAKTIILEFKLSKAEQEG